MIKDLNGTVIYSIIHTASYEADSNFTVSKARGSFLTLESARRELELQIASEKEQIPLEYDCEELGKDFWLVYQDGFAAAAFSRLEIVSTTLRLQPSA